MGFVQVREGEDGQLLPGNPKETIKLEHLEPQTGPLAGVRWLMLEPLGYEVPDGVAAEERFVVAPKHEVGQSTDLASVPPWLWGVIASFGRHTLPALMHDHLCERAQEAPPGRSGPMRRQADRLFRVAMRESGVPAVRAWLMWAAVRLFGEVGQPRLLAKLPAAVVVAAAAAAWTAVGLSLAGSADVAWRVVLTAAEVVLAAAAITLLRGRKDLAGAIAVGAAGGTLIAPALLISLATSILIDLPAWVAWSARLAAYGARKAWRALLRWLDRRAGGRLPAPMAEAATREATAAPPRRPRPPQLGLAQGP